MSVATPPDKRERGAREGAGRMASEADRDGEGGRGDAACAARAVTKRFAGVTALDGVDFDLRAGEVHALIGENGAGKSTLMKILSGVHTDYDGEIAIAGDAGALRQRPRRRGGRGRDHPPGAEPRPGARASPRTSSSAASRCSPASSSTAAPSVAAARGAARPASASTSTRRRGSASLRVGEQQLVEIAKALSLEARILIMDEPTSALSPAECARLFRIVRQLAADGVGIVYISHRIDEVIAPRRPRDRAARRPPRADRADRRAEPRAA